MSYAIRDMLTMADMMLSTRRRPLRKEGNRGLSSLVARDTLSVYIVYVSFPQRMLCDSPACQML